MYGDETAAQEEVDRVLAAADSDGNGFLDYTEFLVASMNKQTLLCKENLEAAFIAFDTDGSGSITVEELKTMLGSENVQDTVWE
jgi:calcium-dependent protein kinase